MSRVREGVAVAALLTAQLALLAHGVLRDGMTYDELLYVASGYRQVALGDHRFGAEHPPLALALAALPLLALEVNVRPIRPGGSFSAFDFVHRDNRDVPLLAVARASIVALSLVLSLVVWRFTRAAYGPPAGLAALAVAVFHPSLLAHGHLVTTDLAGALAMVSTSWAMWRWCTAPSPARAAMVGLLLGALLSTRLTGLLLLPVLAVLAVQWWRRSAARPSRAAELGWLAGACAALVPLVIWAAYGFRHDAWPGEPWPTTHPPYWVDAVRGTLAMRIVDALDHVVPAGYWASLQSYVVASTMLRWSYLLGEVSSEGWRHYYLVTLLVKNTPGFLIALGALAVAWRRIDRGSALHWLLPAGVVFVAASLLKVQLGDRYILPVYPYLAMAMGALAPSLLRSRGGQVFMGAVLLLHAAPMLLGSRHGLVAYTNPLVGHARAHLVVGDSSFDWGQDLPRLAAWVREHPGPLQLAYWGTDDPSRYALGQEDLPGRSLYDRRRPDRPFTGRVAVSPALLLGIVAPPNMEGVYPRLQQREPLARAGVFFIYDLGP
jgi:uncharacterized protein YqgC (DUF456 family)